MKRTYKNKSFTTKQKAFTLVELLIVIAIIGILFVVIVSKVDFATDKSKATGVQTDFRSFQVAFDAVAREHQGFAELVNKSDYSELVAAINKNLDNKLKISIDSMGKISMLNGTTDPWDTQYHGEYIVGEDGKDRGALVIYSNGANTKFGSDISITGGTASISTVNDFGKDDYAIVSCFSLAEGYGKIDTVLKGFGNLASGNNNSNVGVETPDTPETPEVPDTPTVPEEPVVPEEPETPAIPSEPSMEGVVAGLYESGSNYTVRLKTWDELCSEGIISSSTNKAVNKTALVGDLVIPNTVKTIEESAFAGCTGLTKVNFEEGSTLYRLYDYVFSGCTSLISVTLPDTVTSLGEYVFESTALEYMILPEGLKSVPRETFDGCQKLAYVKLPSTITEIGRSAFASCISLENIELPEGLKTLYPYAFRSCTGLTSIIIPSTVTSIGGSIMNTECGSFASCSNLSSVIFAPNSQLKSIGDGAFSGCPLESFEIPSTVTSIGIYSFSGSPIKELFIPKSVTTIKKGAFSGAAIETLIFEDGSNLTTVDYGAFKNCKSLTSVRIPASLTIIEGHHQYGGIFEGSGLVEVTFEEGSQLTKINNYAFKGCSSLVSFMIDADSSCNYIGPYAFENCSSLTNMTIPNAVTTINKYTFSGSGLQEISIPDNVLSIEAGAFYNCKKLTTVNFGENSKLQYLKQEYFNGWIGAFANCSSLTSIVLPESLISIDSAVFINCKKLSSVTIPASITELPGVSNTFVFLGCTSLHTIYYTGTLEQWCAIEWDMSPFNYGAALYIQGELVEHLTFENTNITEVGGWSNCTSLKSVHISDNVTTINGAAFKDCPNLETVTMGDGVVTIGSQAFYNCKKLTNVQIGNNVETLQSSVFYGCESIRTVTMGPNINSIADYVFYDCDNSKTIYFTGTLEQWLNMDWSANWCSPLDKYGTLYIQGELLVDVVIPDGTTTLNSRIFYRCTSVKSIYIPKSVTNIYRTALMYSSINTVVYEGTMEEWEAISKGSDWNKYSNIYKVQCSDGVVSTPQS